MTNYHATANGPVPFTEQEEVEWAAMQASFIPDYSGAVRLMLDSKAHEMGYDNIVSAISYVGDPDSRFDAEGVAFRDWRSAVWSEHNAKLEAIKNGAEKISVDEFLTQMPIYGA